ncbi:MAG: PAS-domain containing protein [Alphaproteobacteria bacterium]|nr:PAS-domain containing protein [Alphaproteobacteria bacterium]
MRVSLKLWMIIGILSLIALIGGIIILSALSVQTVERNRTAVFHTYKVLDTAQHLLSEVQDLETGQRGYLLTGQAEYLSPYELAKPLIGELTVQLTELTTDNQRHQVRLASLRALIEQKMQVTEQSIELVREGDVEQALLLVNRGIGRETMDSIRELIRQMSLDERQLLAQRSEEYVTSNRRTMGIQIAAVLLFGAMIAFAAIMAWRDYRRRVEAEGALKVESALLKATLENMGQGISVFGPDLKLMAWNENFLQLLDYPVSLARQGTDFDAFLNFNAARGEYGSGNLAEEVARRRAVAVKRNRDVYITERSRPDGRILELVSNPMPDGGFVTTYTDITIRQQAERQIIEQGEQLLDRETRLRAVIDNVPVGIITINESGSIESFNRQSEQIFGYAAEDVMRRNVNILMPEPDHTRHDGYLASYRKTGIARIIGQNREVTALRANGETFPMDLAISEMWLGERRLFVGMVRDITERKQMERLKNEFVSTVSHELRTPLTSISGSLGLIMGGIAGDISAKAKHLIGIAHSNSERLIRLINDILDIEKIESGKMVFIMAPQPLVPLVEQSIEANRAYAEKYGTSFVLQEDIGDAQVKGDPDRLIQVFTNLLSNAAKYSPAGTPVEVSAVPGPLGLRIAIRDYGSGIPEEFKNRIFQKFAQADGSDTKQKGGTGLGLSIVKNIVESHGGQVDFESEIGSGTTFFVDLPLWEETDDSADAQSDRPMVLICEDDPDIATILSETLRHAGYGVDVCYSASAARTLLDRRSYVAMTLDLKLPDADGFSFLNALRANETTRNLPIIIISAADLPEDGMMSGQALSIVDWLSKPVDYARLLSAVELATGSVLKGARILHVEDDPDIAAIVREAMGGQVQIDSVASLADARLRLAANSYDLAIIDIELIDGSGLDVLPMLSAPGRPPIPALIFSAHDLGGDFSEQVQAVLTKSKTTMSQLVATIRQAIAKSDRPGSQG